MSRLSTLVRRGSAFEAELLGHLGEMDARRLYLSEGCPSMFGYCVTVLHFAESVAHKRIAAARAVRRHPAILEAVRCGDLHLTGVGLLAPRLTFENCADLIAAARHQTADVIRRLLVDREPKPDAPTSVRRIPVNSALSAPEETSATPVANDVRESEKTSRTGPNETLPLASEPVAEAGARTRSEPLGGERYCVRFTAGPKLHAKIQELRALMRHQIPDGDVAKILARAVEVLLEQIRKAKLGQTDKPRPRERASERPSRHVPAWIRREVWKRDAGRCSFV